MKVCFSFSIGFIGRLIGVLVLVMLMIGWSGWAQGTEHSPYPPLLQGDDFFISGKPAVGYLTLQPRYTVVENDSQNSTESHYFSLRRAKLRLLGQPLSEFRYYIQGIYKTHNFSPTDNEIFLQEAWARWEFSPSLRLQVGQFIPPMGLERFTPDEMLYTIDRSQVTDHLIPNGNLGDSFSRDYGAQLSGNLFGDQLTYAMAVMGGNGANEGHVGGNGSYLLDGRMTWRPYWSKDGGLDLLLGGAISFRRNHDLNLSQQLPGSGSLGYGHFNGIDWHHNLFLDLRWGPVSFRGEGFYARYEARSSGLPSLSADGFYLQAAYFLSPRWQIVGKYETFDPNLALHDSGELHWTTLGLNFYLLGNQLKLMANYIFKSEGRDEIHNDTFIVQAQFFFSYPRNPRLESWRER